MENKEKILKLRKIIDDVNKTEKNGKMSIVELENIAMINDVDVLTIMNISKKRNILKNLLNKLTY